MKNIFLIGWVCSKSIFNQNPQKPVEHTACIVCPWYVIIPRRIMKPTSRISNLNPLIVSPDFTFLQTVSSFNNKSWLFWYIVNNVKLFWNYTFLMRNCNKSMVHLLREILSNYNLSQDTFLYLHNALLGNGSIHLSHYGIS